MKQFEYKYEFNSPVESKEIRSDFLARNGREGWQVVDVTGYHFLFIRELDSNLDNL